MLVLRFLLGFAVFLLLVSVAVQVIARFSSSRNLDQLVDRITRIGLKWSFLERPKPIHVSEQEGPVNFQQLQDGFLENVFTMLGILAKSDGVVDEVELNLIDRWIAERLDLTGSARQRAIDFFRRGKSSLVPISIFARTFFDIYEKHPSVRQALFEFMVELAMIDGKLNDYEHSALRDVAQVFGIARAKIVELEAYFEERFARRATRQKSSSSSAWKTLTLEPNAGSDEVKKRYRKLVQQYHPDKLVGPHRTEDSVQQATEKFREIQEAYDSIMSKRARA